MFFAISTIGKTNFLWKFNRWQNQLKKDIDQNLEIEDQKMIFIFFIKSLTIDYCHFIYTHLFGPHLVLHLFVSYPEGDASKIYLFGALWGSRCKTFC